MNAPGIKELGPKQYQVRVRLRHHARTGKGADRRELVHGTAADAVRARDKLLASLTSTSTVRPRTLLRDFLIEWIKRKAVVKASTLRRYLYACKHLGEDLGGIYLEALTRLDVERYLGRRVADGASGGTARCEYRVLRGAMRDAVDEGYIAKSFCDRVALPDVDSYDDERPNLLTPEQAAKLVLAIPKQWLGLVLFLFTTSLRIGEATALRWEDIDDAGVVRVRRNNDRGTETTTKTKGSKRSVIALPEIVALFGLRRPTGIIFPARTGNMRRGSPLRAVLDKACARVGVPRLTAHGLRRTFNDIGRRNTTQLVLQAMTGHTTDEMTAKYSRVDAGEKTAVARAIATAIGVISVSGPRTRSIDK